MSKRPSYLCPRCGKVVGWLGRVLPRSMHGCDLEHAVTRTLSIVDRLAEQRDAFSKALADIEAACVHSPYRMINAWDPELAKLIHSKARNLPASTTQKGGA